MARPTLDDLYARHGVQQAQYLDDYLAARGGYLVFCGQCGRMLVVGAKPTREEARKMRCPECQAKAKAERLDKHLRGQERGE